MRNHWHPWGLMKILMILVLSLKSYFLCQLQVVYSTPLSLHQNVFPHYTFYLLYRWPFKIQTWTGMGEGKIRIANTLVSIGYSVFREEFVYYPILYTTESTSQFVFSEYFNFYPMLLPKLYELQFVNMILPIWFIS